MVNERQGLGATSEVVPLAGGGGFGFWWFFLGRGNVGLDERDVHEMLGKEPDLEFVGADDVTDEQVIRAVVAGLVGLFGHGARFFENCFVSFE